LRLWHHYHGDAGGRGGLRAKLSREHADSRRGRLGGMSRHCLRGWGNGDADLGRRRSGGHHGHWRRGFGWRGWGRRRGRRRRSGALRIGLLEFLFEVLGGNLI
jgi:hypothetical protein